ncbi:MAG: DUF29 domain-containing protein [Gammaproteobacteria bacterium]|nr:DUF29 domain-containing protein [Gammaproteobacteria bacterium]MBU1654613.1 DUF29 domain-containing protein [Gammaproteobacteria bacterium]MBU1959943.1 DUF29 domain-containing protein [Gammaproteobacteria bacterium]
MGSASYNQDLYTWAQEQAALLRERRFDQIDLEHIIEEIEDMGKSEKRALESFFETLLMLLLKWQYQPAYQGWSWKYTIIEQRKRIERHLKENPGLKSQLPEILESAYEYAVTGAIRETGLAPETFPPTCPWTYEQCMDKDFWPETGL